MNEHDHPHSLFPSSFYNFGSGDSVPSCIRTYLLILSSCVEYRIPVIKLALSARGKFRYVLYSRTLLAFLPAYHMWHEGLPYSTPTLKYVAVPMPMHVWWSFYLFIRSLSNYHSPTIPLGCGTLIQHVVQLVLELPLVLDTARTSLIAQVFYWNFVLAFSRCAFSKRRDSHAN